MENAVKRFFTFTAIVLLLACAIMTTAANTTVASSTEAIKIAVNDDDAPFTFIQANGHLTGLYVDIWSAWSESSGIPVEFIATTHKQSIRLLHDGLVDMQAGLFRSDKRAQWADFSLPIAKVQTKLYFNGDDQFLPDLSQLSGKKVAVGLDTFQEDYIRSKYPEVIIVTFFDYMEVTDKLMNHEVVAIVAEEPVMNRYLTGSGLKGIIISRAKSIFINTVHGMILKQNQELKKTIDDGLENIPIEKLRLIERKWISELTAFFNDNYSVLPSLTMSEQEWLENNQNFTLGISPSLMPFEWVDEQGNYIGISADYIDLVKNTLSIEMHPYKNISWVEVLNKVAKKEIDILSAVVKTKSRESFLDFTKPYISFPLVIATNNESNYVESLSDLDFKIVGVEKSNPAEEILAINFPNIIIQTVDTAKQGMELLESQQINAYVHNLGVITYHINSGDYTNVKVAAFTPYRLEIAMAVRKDLGPMVKILDKALANISVKERQKIKNSWLAVQLNLGTKATTFALWTLPILAILMLIIAWMRRNNRRLETEISARVAIEERLVAAKAKAESANLAKNNFLANMSHEIRTPMNAVIGFSEILKGSGLNQQQNEQNNMLYSSASTLLALLNDILDLSKVEADKLVLERRKINLKNLIHTITSQLEFIVHKVDVCLTVNVAEDVPETLWGDGLRLTQILTNLMNNAVKFTEKGEVNLSVIKLHGDENIIELEFRIDDSGIGMTEQQLDNLFDTYNQADSSTTRKYGGTGLGLAISKKLCELMGGKIWVISHVGQGSKFCFTAQFNKQQSKVKDQTIITDQNIHKRHPILAGKNILLVDDNKVNLIVAEAHLKKAEMKVCKVVNGQEAVDAVQNQQFDAILMDISMPVMDGYDATKIIRNQLGFTQLPIIAVSANVMADDGQKSLDVGMNAHLGKPINVDLLMSTLAKYIEKSQL